MAHRKSSLEDLAMIQNGFWRGKRVFLTGHTGFKGSWLSLWLQRLGANVTGYALLPPTTPSLFEQAAVANGMTSLLGNICDADTLSIALRQASPDVVIHMAAQSLVRQSYEDPAGTYMTNVMGTVNLLEAVRAVDSVRSVLIVTSDKCYENKERLEGYREDEAMGGYDPYSNSKGCAELVVSSYRSSYFNPSRWEQHGVSIATARAGNVIGGGDWASNRLIPDMIRAFQDHKPVNIRNPSAVRPWQHVLDPLHGYLVLAQNMYEKGPMFGGGWNFGPLAPDRRPVQWIVGKMCELWQQGATWVIDPEKGPHETHYLSLDCSKAHEKLHWSPVWELEKSLPKIVDWYRTRHEGGDITALSFKQIEDYERDLQWNRPE